MYLLKRQIGKTSFYPVGKFATQIDANNHIEKYKDLFPGEIVRYKAEEIQKTNKTAPNKDKINDLFLEKFLNSLK